MAKIFIIMGKSASGKDSIFKKIVDNNNELKTVISYTTRPIRQGETDGVEYYFVTKDMMDNLSKEGKIIECRSYNTVHGLWYYFTADDGQIDLYNRSYIIIGTPEGYKKLARYYGRDVIVPIYIEAGNKERLLRAIKREEKQSSPNYSEVCRRYLADEEDFSDVILNNCDINKAYINNDLGICSEQILADIKKLM